MSGITKLLLCAVSFLTVIAILRYWFMSWFRRWNPRQELAKHEAMCSGTMEYTEVSPGDFPWVDESFYDEVSLEMADSGFRFVGDFESLTARKLYSNMRTFLRWFINDTDSTVAACYHIRRLGLTLGRFRRIPKHMKIIEFGSEFTDHSFLETSNAGGLNVFTDCAGITVNQLALGTPLDKLLAVHRQGIERILAQCGVKPIRLRTMEDMRASGDRSHALKSAQKKRAGYVTREQWEKMAGGELSGPQQEFVREFEKARDEDDTDQ